jgi:hypothetical protein
LYRTTWPESVVTMHMRSGEQPISTGAPYPRESRIPAELHLTPSNKKRLPDESNVAHQLIEGHDSACKLCLASTTVAGPKIADGDNG